MIIIDKANYMFCVFCGEDAKKIKEEGKALLACTSCGKVISYLEVDKAAVETFKAMGGQQDFPDIKKEPSKVRIPLLLDRHVTYLHVQGKTWERVPMHLYVHRTVSNDGRETDFQPVLRIGNNTYEFNVHNFVSGSTKSYRGGSVTDHHIDTKKVNRKALLNADFGYDDHKWPSKPLLKRGDYGYKDEIIAWKDRAKKRKKSIKQSSKKELKRFKKWSKLTKKEAKERVKESEFIKVITPFVRRGESKAINVYQALSNMRWRRISDGKEYSCTWRYAGGLVADIRKKNETYMDFYCSGNEGNVTKEFEQYMKRKGWEKLPWD